MFKSGEPPYFNLSYYNNPTLDKKITEVDPLSATDRQAAINMYTDIQTTLLQDSPALFLGVQTYQRAMQKSVSGYVDNPAYPNVVFVHTLTPKA
jgi:peptide/nickel transport system substrate-binding protein